MPSSDGMATHLDSLLTLLVSPYQYTCEELALFSRVKRKEGLGASKRHSTNDCN